jgi:hypothetical protein
MPIEAWTKNTWPCHNGQVQINLSKMTGRFFFKPAQNGSFLTKSFSKTNRNSNYVCIIQYNYYHY